MTDIFRRQRGSAAVSWFDQRPRRSNQHCLYCGQFVGEGSDLPSGREHLVGRNMVPPNSFKDATAFNFVFRACTDCNGEKSRVEGHISAVSLLSSSGRSERTDVDAAARQKAAGSFDPAHRGRPVSEVRNEHTIKFGSAISVSLISTAQLEPSMVRLLAFRHIQGFFSLATSADPLKTEGTRLLPSSHFGFFWYYGHPDWGNPQLLEVGRRVRGILGVIQVHTANGYFRSLLRRAEPDGSPWFWALEWNKSVRLIGWIGEPDNPPDFYRDLPPLEWQDLGIQAGVQTRVRQEIPLAEQDDALFDFGALNGEGKI